MDSRRIRRFALKTSAAAFASVLTLTWMREGIAQSLPSPKDPSNPKLVSTIWADPTGPGAEVRIGISKIRVKDMNASIRFYEDVFGFRQFARTDHTAFLGFPGGRLPNQPANSYSDPVLQLIYDPYLELPKINTYVIMFRVRDMKAWRERARKLGYAVNDRVGGKHQVSTINDPNGQQMEVGEDGFFAISK